MTEAKLQRDAKGQFVPGNCLASKNAYYHDPAVMEAAVNDYFQQYEDQDLPPTVTTLSLFLGFTGRQRFHDYLNLPGRKPYSDILKRAKSKIEGYRLEKMLTNKNNVIAGIFDLKNNFGYIDKQVSETDIKVTQSFTPEDRQALKDLALQMIEAREMEDEPLLIEGSVSSNESG